VVAYANGDYTGTSWTFTADNANLANTGGDNTISSFKITGSATTTPGVISLKAHANGDYVCVDNAGAAALIANRTAIGVWESFDLINNADGSISLRSHANNDYVTAENAGAAALIANRTAIGGWEEFDLIRG
jgi:hypothetical protein